MFHIFVLVYLSEQTEHYEQSHTKPGLITEATTNTLRGKEVQSGICPWLIWNEFLMNHRICSPVTVFSSRKWLRISWGLEIATKPSECSSCNGFDGNVTSEIKLGSNWNDHFPRCVMWSRLIMLLQDVQTTAEIIVCGPNIVLMQTLLFWKR